MMGGLPRKRNPNPKRNNQTKTRRKWSRKSLKSLRKRGMTNFLKNPNKKLSKMQTTPPSMPKTMKSTKIRVKMLIKFNK